MVGYIYRITNIQTQKVYVGITEDYERRRKKHLKELRENVHHSPKLQRAWNYWGEENFEFSCRSVEIKQYEDLYDLEIAEIKKYNSYNDGYNCNSGGRISDWKQKVNNQDIVKFLCIQWKYGDGYGKTAEEIFGWAKGTASSAKRKKRYIDAWYDFEKLTDEEKEKIAIDTFNNYCFEEKSLSRKLSQGGCEKAYQLTQEDYNFAFAAQELGYTYSQVAKYFGVKPTTVNDWFRGKSRVKNKETYKLLSQEEKETLFDKVKSAHLEAQGHDKFINKKEEDVISFLCYDKFFPQNDASIQRLFGWSEGTCYAMRKEGNYPYSKSKVFLLSEEEQKNIANNLQSRLLGGRA